MNTKQNDTAPNTKAQTKISIIVPVYNVEKFLQKCIESILAQSYSNFELILVDDGSPDNSGEICDTFASKDNRIQVIHKQNGGVSSARNAGIEASSGEWISFVDPDDYADIDFLAEAVNHMDGNPDLLVFGFKYIYSNDFNSFEVKCIDENCETRTFLQKYFDFFSENNILNAIYAKVYKSSIIKANRIAFFEQFSICEDSHFVIDFLRFAQQIRCVDKSVYNYVQHDNLSLMKRFNRNALEAKVSEVQSTVALLSSAQFEKDDPLFHFVYGKSIHFYFSQIIHLFTRFTGSRKERYRLLKEYVKNDFFQAHLKFYRPENRSRRLMKSLIKHKMSFLLYTILEFKDRRERKGKS